MGLREYARHRGVHLKAVQDAITIGRISVVMVNGAKKINPKISDIEWDKNKDPSKVRNEKDMPKIEDDSFGDWKRHNEKFKAKKSEIEYKNLAGELVSIEQVKKDAFKIAKSTSDALMGIPARVCHELAAEKNPDKVFKKLDDEIRQAMIEICKKAGFKIPIEKKK